MSAPISTTDALKAKLAAAKAARESLQEAKETEPEDVRLQRELDDEIAITAAIEAHGAIGDGIAVMRTKLGCVILKRPKQAAWRRFSDAKQTTGAEARALAVACLAHPTAQAFDAICEAYPAALEQAGALACDLARAKGKEDAGK